MAVRGWLEALGCVLPHATLSVVPKLHGCVCQAAATTTHDVDPGSPPESSGLLVSIYASVLVAESAGHVPLSL